MRRSLNRLKGYTIRATDGECGHVDDVYFDDGSWSVRYLVVNTGGGWAGRKVLVSPPSLGRPDGESLTFPVRLTMDQVRNSPSIDTDMPVSRQHAVGSHWEYPWPVNWCESLLFPMGPCAVMSLSPVAVRARGFEQAKRNVPSPATGDPHLRSLRRVTGYEVLAEDGGAGYVRDFIVDDRDWGIRALVVDTGNWLSSRRVLVAPEKIARVSWAKAGVLVRMTRDSIRDAPEFDPSKPVHPDDEGNL